jgi:predicted ester cyclase
MKILPRMVVGIIILSLSGTALSADVSANKVVARKILEEVLGQGKILENEHLYSPKFAAHGKSQAAGREKDREATKAWRLAFPDLKITVSHLVGEGEFVTVRFIGEGTNTGPIFGQTATGKFIKVAGITIFRLENGQITDEWTSFDEMGLLGQLGLLPTGK